MSIVEIGSMPASGVTVPVSQEARRSIGDCQRKENLHLFCNFPLANGSNKSAQRIADIEACFKISRTQVPFDRISPFNENLS